VHFFPWLLNGGLRVGSSVKGVMGIDYMYTVHSVYCTVVAKALLLYMYDTVSIGIPVNKNVLLRRGACVSWLFKRHGLIIKFEWL
jgi:hypothetical protein